MALYAKNGFSSPIKSLFSREFPEVARFLRKVKADYETWKTLLQKKEADFIIHGVADRIRKERRGMFLATIHDSLVCQPENKEYVAGVMRDEFAKLGMAPVIE